MELCPTLSVRTSTFLHDYSLIMMKFDVNTRLLEEIDVANKSHFKFQAGLSIFRPVTYQEYVIYTL